MILFCAATLYLLVDQDWLCLCQLRFYRRIKVFCGLARYTAKLQLFSANVFLHIVSPSMASFLRSCVALALNRGDCPAIRYTPRRNTAIIMKVWHLIFFYRDPFRQALGYSEEDNRWGITESSGGSFPRRLHSQSIPGAEKKYHSNYLNWDNVV